MWRISLPATCLLLLAVGETVAQQPIRNLTGRPDDVAAARMLGYVAGVLEKCPNLEEVTETRSRMLATGRITEVDIAPGGRRHADFEEQRVYANQLSLDPDCAGPLGTLRLSLRVKPGYPMPTGPGYIQMMIAPANGPLR